MLTIELHPPFAHFIALFCFSTRKNIYGHFVVQGDISALRNAVTLLQLIYPEGCKLFTALLAGGLGEDERPGTRPRRAKGWEGNS